jgi:hypothetical protein
MSMRILSYISYFNGLFVFPGLDFQDGSQIPTLVLLKTAQGVHQSAAPVGGHIAIDCQSEQAFLNGFS